MSTQRGMHPLSHRDLKVSHYASDGVHATTATTTPHRGADVNMLRTTSIDRTCAAIVFLSLMAVSGSRIANAQPNIVLIYADDLGWGDLSCFGNRDRSTPHLDRMATEGARLTDFYVSTPSCAPSRVALLTGRYPYRTGVPSNPAPDASRDHGIKASETTLAEALKSVGYATRCVGKWHLGHLPQYYPTKHGFDEYFGILYSNDMRPVMLVRDEQAVEYPVVQSYLTRRYTSAAIEFIEHNRDRNFFLYLPHAMPHKPLAASEEFYTPETRDDLYSDVVRELDWSIGRVIDKLRELNLDRKTLVIFASDNGPTYGGSSGGLRGTKGATFEGGIRVPGIVWWPGTVPAGQVISNPCATLDLFPTICKLVGIDTAEFNLDGFDIMPMLTGAGPAPERAIYSWQGIRLMTVRQGRWKLHVNRSNVWRRGNKGDEWIDPRGPDGVTLIAPPEQYEPWQYPSPADTAETVPPGAGLLFDLENDLHEQRDVAAEHPEVMQRLTELAEAAAADAQQTPQPEISQPNRQFYLGPGRITEENAISIDEALRRTRGR